MKSFPENGMTEDDAESILVAAELGMFHGSRSELGHAALIIAQRDKRWEEEQRASEELASSGRKSFGEQDFQ